MLGKFIREYLNNDQLPAYKSEVFRASAAGKCYLYRCFLREGIKESNPFSQDVLGAFAIGNLLHEWLQEKLDSRGILLDQELSVEYLAWDCRGHFDAIIQQDGLIYLYDFKTINSKRFEYLSEPSKNYIYQILTYYLITVTTTKYTKIDKVCIAYISKDSLKVKEYFIDITTNKLLQKVVNDWETLMDIWNNKKYKNIKLFREEYADYLKNDAGCNLYCSYYEYCRNLK